MTNTPTRLKEITVGCDPEFFLKHNNKFIPAYITEIQGTKDKPLKLKSGGAVQIDGMALEFNIEPQTTFKGFWDAIYDTLSEIRKLVDPRLEFEFRPDANFDQTVFDATPSKFKELGCDPDYSAYNLQAKTPPNDAAGKPFRTAGGHWHFGYLEGLKDAHDPLHIFDVGFLVRGLEAINQIKTFDHYSKRTMLYGAAGSFRPKLYGFEWRSPSNSWLNLPKDRLQNVFDLNVRELNFLLDKKEFVITRTNNHQIGDFAEVATNLTEYSALSNWVYHVRDRYVKLPVDGIAAAMQAQQKKIISKFLENEPFNYSNEVKKNYFILNESKVEQTINKRYRRAA